MKFKIGDIVEVIEILPEWDIWKDRDKIYNKPCKILGSQYDMYNVAVPNATGWIFLKEKRLKLFEIGKQLEFNFMGE